MENKYKKENLYIAELRYLDKENGIEYDSPLSYAILYKKDDIYYNIFNIYEDFPVFERSRHYSNCTKDGLEYGTKMIKKYGVVEDGPCWVIDYQFPLNNEEFTKGELEDYIINDDRYFKDRIKIIKSKIKNPIRLFKILYKDSADLDYMNYYFDKREVQKVKKNKKTLL